MNRNALDPVATEVVLWNTLLVVIACYMFIANPYPHLFYTLFVKPESLVFAGYAVLIAGAVLAEIHRPIPNRVHHILWRVSIGAGWVGSLLVADGVIGLPPDPGNIVIATFAIAVLLMITAIRASRPRGMMLLRILDGRERRAESMLVTHQLALPLR